MIALFPSSLHTAAAMSHHHHHHGDGCGHEHDDDDHLKPGEVSTIISSFPQPTDLHRASKTIYTVGSTEKTSPL